MNKEEKHIEKLFTDTSPINVKEAVEALEPFVSIQRQTKDIFLKNHERLTVEEKIIAYALAKKLLKIRGYINNDIISASEIHKKIGIKKGSVDYSFKKLRESGLLVGRGKNYEVPNHKVDKIVQRLKLKSKIK
ncbi:hypothetical protein J7J74_03165 [bacterium]|nr:hypothetical protein [bacterium]